MALATAPQDVLHRRVRRTLDAARFSLVGRDVLALCSGGADSVALVGLLGDLASGAAPRSIAVLWLDHGLRGDIADERAAAVEAAAAVGAGFHERSASAGAVRGAAGGVEAAARAWRYAAAQELAQEIGADTVATGHTADDQLELALLSLVGVTGRAGEPTSMPLHRSLGDHGIQLVRPLLGLAREEILGYCAARGLVWAEDPSNADVRAHVRNAVRARVVPPLLAAHPGAGRALLRAAARSDERAAASQALASALLDASPVATATTLDRRMLGSLPVGAQRELIAQWLRRAGLGRVRTAKLVDQVLELRPGARIDLPGTACVRRDGYGLHITQAAPGGATQ